MVSVKTVFDDGKYRVVEFQGSSIEPLVISFSLWRPEPGLDTPAFSEAFLQKYGISYVCIKTADNDWYQNGVGPALEAVRACIRGRRCISYGASMGGYAAVNFAPDLGVERVVAFAPQFSIDRAKVPFEYRWRKEAELLTYQDDRIAEPSDIPCTVVYDPFVREDASHVDLIARSRTINAITIPFASHSVETFLRDCGLLSKVAIALITESFDYKSFRKELRAKRPNVATAWHEASRAVWEIRRNPRRAMDFAIRGTQCACGSEMLSKYIDQLRVHVG